MGKKGIVYHSSLFLSFFSEIFRPPSFINLQREVCKNKQF